MNLPALPAAASLSSEDFAFFREALEANSGISLSQTKQGLLISRLRSTLEDLGLGSFAEYRKFLETRPEADSAWTNFVEMMTTNKTDFFREEKHFDYLVNHVLPTWSPDKPLNAWSAACSTGEEPYTLAMVLDRHLPPASNFRILASDIDSNVLQVAAEGVYPSSRIREQVPVAYREGAIDFGSGQIENWARVKPRLKKTVTVKVHNLVEESYPGEEIFDLIFLRNVLIYFAPETIRFVVEKLSRSAKPGALLFISHSESLNNIPTSWKSVAPSIYRK